MWTLFKVASAACGVFLTFSWYNASTVSIDAKYSSLLMKSSDNRIFRSLFFFAFNDCLISLDPSVTAAARSLSVYSSSRFRLRIRRTLLFAVMFDVAAAEDCFFFSSSASWDASDIFRISSNKLPEVERVGRFIGTPAQKRSNLNCVFYWGQDTRFVWK